MFALLACVVDHPDSAPVDTSTLPDPGTLSLAGACPLDERRGGFEVSVNELYSTVGGSVADAVLPVSVLTPVATVGECTLLRRENPACDPTCSPGETCDLSGTCVLYPVNQDLGIVRIDGLVDAVGCPPCRPARPTSTPPSPSRSSSPTPPSG